MRWIALICCRVKKKRISSSLITDDADELVEISSSLSELGKITEQCPVQQWHGEHLKIAFNSKYMLDALKVIDSDTVYLGFNGAMKPILVRPQDDDRMLHLMLPYRTTS